MSRCANQSRDPRSSDDRIRPLERDPPAHRNSRPITIADGRPSEPPTVVTALVIALLLKMLKTSRIGSKRVLPRLERLRQPQIDEIRPRIAEIARRRHFHALRHLRQSRHDRVVVTVKVRACGRPDASRIEPANCTSAGSR